MASRQPDSCNFCAIAQAMLRLLARPKITAVFCDSLTSAPEKKVVSNLIRKQTQKTCKVYQCWAMTRHSCDCGVRQPGCRFFDCGLGTIAKAGARLPHSIRIGQMRWNA